jgi:hypothetical protein
VSLFELSSQRLRVQEVLSNRLEQAKPRRLVVTSKQVVLDQRLEEPSIRGRITRRDANNVWVRLELGLDATDVASQAVGHGCYPVPCQHETSLPLADSSVAISRLRSRVHGRRHAKRRTLGERTMTTSSRDRSSNATVQLDFGLVATDSESRALNHG